MYKILFYTDTPLLGGAENQMLILAKFLPKDKYAITLACARTKNLNPWCQKFIELDLPVIRLNVFGKHDPRHLIYLKQILPNHDLVHMHVWNPASGRYGFLAASKTPLVITEHDPFYLSGIKGFLKKKLINKAKAIIVASEASKKLVLAQDNALESRIRIIPNGIDIESWRKHAKLENRDEFRRQNFNASPNEKVIICVAELHERKGQKYLISAMHRLCNEFSNLKLVFIGDGPKRKYYEKLSFSLGDRVLFLGRRKEIAKLMAASDLFVLPSIREAFGLVILEASAVGLPIVASKTGGISEIIEDNKTGLLITPENSDELAEAVRKIFLNKEHALDMVKNAYSRVETLFNAKMMAEKTAEVYEKILLDY